MTVAFQCTGPVFSGTADAGSPYKPQTDWVIWIEDADSHYVKTIKVSAGAVTFNAYGHTGGYHLPVWAKSSNEDTLPQYPGGNVLAGFDALTSASLNFAKMKDTLITSTWDFTDTNGIPVPWIS